MFNGKALFLLVIAVAMGVAASLYANNWLQSQGISQADSAEPTVDIVVALREIPDGQKIDDSFLRIVKWPESNAPDSTYSDASMLIDMLATQTIYPGEPILAAKVTDKLEGSRLSSLIEPNKRAITVRVNDVAGVAGFLLPGNRVDVLATRVSNGRANTRQLLQNIKVLAIDQQVNRDKDDPIVVRAVTLEADTEEAVLLTSATAEGTIQLVLRNPTDLATVVEETPVVAAKTVTPRPRRTTREITIIRGTSVGNSEVRL